MIPVVASLTRDELRTPNFYDHPTVEFGLRRSRTPYLFRRYARVGSVRDGGSLRGNPLRRLGFPVTNPSVRDTSLMTNVHFAAGLAVGTCDSDNMRDCGLK